MYPITSRYIYNRFYSKLKTIYRVNIAKITSIEKIQVYLDYMLKYNEFNTYTESKIFIKNQNNGKAN